MRPLEEIRNALLTAKAMQSLSHHHGFHDLVKTWEKMHKGLAAQMLDMVQWDALALGRWQGQMKVLNTVLTIAKDAKAAIPRLEKDLRSAEQSASVHGAVWRRARRFSWGLSVRRAGDYR